MLAGELVMVKQGDGGIEIVSQMVRGITSVASAAMAVDTAAVKHMWERRESSCGHELSNLFGSLALPRLA
jgi:cell division GTPase FtsZ